MHGQSTGSRSHGVWVARGLRASLGPPRDPLQAQQAPGHRAIHRAGASSFLHFFRQVNFKESKWQETLSLFGGPSCVTNALLHHNFLDSEMKVSAKGHDRRKADKIYSLKYLSWHCLGLDVLLKAWASLPYREPPQAWSLGGESEVLRVQNSDSLSAFCKFKVSMPPNPKCSGYLSCLILILALLCPNLGEGLELPYAIGKDVGGYEMLSCRHHPACEWSWIPFVQTWTFKP